MMLYKVTRYCCTSGLCADCHARGNHGNLDKRQRVVQADRLTLKRAQKYIAGWARWDPKIEPMDAA